MFCLLTVISLNSRLPSINRTKAKNVHVTQYEKRKNEARLVALAFSRSCCRFHIVGFKFERGSGVEPLSLPLSLISGHHLVLTYLYVIASLFDSFCSFRCSFRFASRRFPFCFVPFRFLLRFVYFFFVSLCLVCFVSFCYVSFCSVSFFASLRFVPFRFEPFYFFRFVSHVSVPFRFCFVPFHLRSVPVRFRFGAGSVPTHSIYVPFRFGSVSVLISVPFHSVPFPCYLPIGFPIRFPIHAAPIGKPRRFSFGASDRTDRRQFRQGEQGQLAAAKAKLAGLASL